ncbi:serine hydrolase domain-containing protein [Gillisia limnaea]|uniref:Beta-lactamase n=1 Tax=Gillisia limnaea (strain DSM 15749 / LMG 21470 / R-8282) TaxID=865937 RepID=H2BXJ1_GILLR|nr:serine hydrolase domain-containing protein [Gillisia limnaea]EHQ02073.1 beta-lactamase [Gillisia limnaea DSM 15749]
MRIAHLTLILFFIISGCKSSEKTIEQQTDKQSIVDYLFQNYFGENPSASFIVIKDGKLKDCQSFGYADLENKVLATCETNYRIGSVTKQFTAMGILVLIDQGKLNYSTKLTEVIPEFPAYGKEISIKDLLLHRSGLQSYFQLYPKDSEKQIVDKDVLNLLKEQDSLLFPANSQFQYSNSGYAILALIMERVSGKTFKNFMDKEIFKKTGMTSSTVYLKDLIIKNRALGYVFNDTKYINKDHNAWSAVQGDGGIYSSVSDYLNWDKSLYNERLVKENLITDAFSNWDQNGKTQGNGYGFGWNIDFRDGVEYLLHGGSTTGFRSFVLRIPSEKIAVAIYTNTEDHNSRELERKALVLASLYSENSIPMPIDFLLEKEISDNGSENIKEYYNKLILNQENNHINKKDLLTLGFKYLSKKEDKNTFNVFTLLKIQFPKYYGGYFGLAQYYKIKGNNLKAVEHYKQMVDLVKNDQRLLDYSKKMVEQLSQ